MAVVRGAGTGARAQLADATRVLVCPSRGDLQRSWTESFVAHSPIGYQGGAVVCLSAAEQDATVALPVATLAKVRAGAGGACSRNQPCAGAQGRLEELDLSGWWPGEALRHNVTRSR